MIKIVTLAFDSASESFDDETIKQFMVGKDIHTIKGELFQQHGKTYWSVWVEYEPILNSTEKKQSEVKLSTLQQELLTDLKQWRREWADQQGMPVFIIGTNKELEAITLQMSQSSEGLRSIPGFGHKKTEKYGKAILQIVARYKDKKNH